jgi:hypothetical protein
MPTLVQRHFWTCIRTLCEWINTRATTITYGELADQLGLKLARQEWNGLLDLIAGKARRELGDDYDLTWIVVYSNGPAEGLGRYFSRTDQPPGSASLDPKDPKQVADYKRKVKEIFTYTYTLETVGGVTTLVKVARSRPSGRPKLNNAGKAE